MQLPMAMGTMRTAHLRCDRHSSFLFTAPLAAWYSTGMNIAGEGLGTMPEGYHEQREQLDQWEQTEQQEQSGQLKQRERLEQQDQWEQTEQRVNEAAMQSILQQWLARTGIPCPDWRAQWLAVRQESAWLHLRQEAHLLREGEGVDRVYFCTTGLFRLYYILPDGREYNKSFALAPGFITSYGALMTNTPSAFSIQALEPSTVLAVPYSLLQRLASQSHAWERLVRMLVEQLYLKKEERERQLLYLDAAGRYQMFLEQYPGLGERIHQYHIASYLGISPVSLSRLIRQAAPHQDRLT